MDTNIADLPSSDINPVWQDRVIRGAELGATKPPEWFSRAYDIFRENVTHPAFPCFFGTLAEKRGEMFYAYAAHRELDHLPETLARFVELSAQKETERNNFALFFEPPSIPFSHSDFQAFCWGILQYLHDRDPLPQQDHVVEPTEAGWEFSFAGTQMFVVGCSPTYKRRRSRNLGDGIILLFQPRSVFIDHVTKKEIGADARVQVRARLMRWDGVAAHPDLGIYGDPDNREWKQYFLPDDDLPEVGICPFSGTRRGLPSSAPILGPKPAWPASEGGILARLKRWAQEQPDKVAVRFLVDGMTQEECVTYRQLENRTSKQAAELLSHGAAGDRVVILQSSGIEYLVSFLACVQAGMIAVPAFPPAGRSGHEKDRLRAIIEDCDPRLLLAGTGNGKIVQDGFPKSLLEGRIVIEATGLTLDRREQTQSSAEPGDVAFLQYTSGSTNSPKGVMVTHANLDANLDVLRQGMNLGQTDVLVSWLPPFHDMGLIAGLLLPVYCGFELVLMTTNHFIRSPLRWLQAVSRYRATVTGGPDIAFRLCVERLSPATNAELNLDSLRIVWSGAEDIRAATMQSFADAFKEYGLNPQAFYPTYGLAEATLMASGHFGIRAGMAVEVFDADELRTGIATPTTQGASLVSCGEAMPEHLLAIVDPDTLQVKADGQVGEIWLSGPSVAAGYWNKSDASKAAFGAELPGSKSAYLRTGDLGLLKNNQLFICGRIKDVIIVFGQNYYPQDIEQKVSEGVEELLAGRVIAFPAVVSGVEGIGIAAEVSRRTAADKNNTDLILDRIHKVIASHYAQSAAVILLLKPGQLPRTTSGKLQRSACASAWKSGSLMPIASFPGKENPTSLPVVLEDLQSETERRVAVLWSDVLGSVHLGPQSDFFECGGQSLAAARLSARIADVFKVELPMEVIFGARTIAAQAKWIDAQARVAEFGPPGIIAGPERSSRPLSHEQERLWFLSRLDPTDTSYTLAGSFRLSGSFNGSALRDAMASVVARHESLRTRFEEREGIAYQIVDNEPRFGWSVHDLSDLPSVERDVAVQAHLRSASTKPFDLEQGPLLRVSMLRLGEQEHILALAIHHIVSDGWSIGILLRELSVFYEGRGKTLAPLPIQYSDYAAWQREWLSDDRLTDQLAYWRDRLGSEQPVLELPTNRPRGVSRSSMGGRVVRELSSDLAATLGAVSRSQSATLFMTLLSGFAALLYRYSGQYDLRIGVPVANRRRLETEGLIGFFVNTLVIRAELSGGLLLTDLLDQIRSRTLEAQANQDVPFDRIVSSMRGSRAPEDNNRFLQVKFLLQETWGEIDRIGDATWTMMDPTDIPPRFDLALDVTPTPAGLHCEFFYDADLLEENVVERLADSYEAILSVMAGPSNLRIGEIPIDASTNSHDITQASTRLVLHRVEALASLYPYRTALAQNDENLTWFQLWQWTEGLAWRLIEAGVSKEAPVAVCLPRGFALVAAVLAIWRTGGFYVPLDVSAPVDHIAWQIRDSGARVTIAEKAASYSYESTQLINPGRHRQLPEIHNLPAWISPTKGQAAYLLYTSGSTGRPKGVLVSHDALTSYLQAVTDRIPDGVTSAAWISTPAADLGHTVLFGSLWSGWTLHIPDDRHLLDPDLFAAYMVIHKIDLLKVVPSHLNGLLHASQPNDVLPRKCLIVGGEATNAKLAARIAILKPECKLLNHYGPTETTVGVLTRSGHETEGPSLPIGRPLANSHVRILDPDGNRVPAGVSGELCVGGQCLARGYYRQAGLTADKFVPDAYGLPGERLYRTGDKVRQFADGEIEFLGRLDDQIKIRGFRVEPEGVADALRENVGVEAAVVVAQRGPQDDMHLVAYVIGRNLDPGSLKEFLKARLPAYMVPAHIVLLKTIPVTANGKIDRRALPPPSELNGQSFVEARTEAERILVSIWKTVLNHTSIGVTDNFFDLGGDSIRSLQIVAKSRKAGLNLTPAQVLEHGTIAALAALATRDKGALPEATNIIETAWLQNNPDVSKPEISTSGIVDTYPATPLQQGLIFHSQMATDDAVYINQLRLTLNGAVDPVSLRAVWEAAMARHEMLRTSFATMPDGKMMQIVHQAPYLPFDYKDWSQSADYDKLFVLWKQEDLKKGLLLTQAPLMRVALFLRPDGNHDLVWTSHHAITDGWSSALLISEVIGDVRARLEDRKFINGEKAPYRDYVAWLSQQVGSEHWWQVRLARLDEAALLSHSLDSSTCTGYGLGRIEQRIGQALSDRLHATAKQWQVTPHTLMQGAWAIVLGRYCNSSSVAFGTIVAGRSAPLPDIERSLGLFINSLPLQVDMRSGQPLGQWFRDLQKYNAELWGQEHTPLSDIQKWLGKANVALFDSLFVFENIPIDETLGSGPGVRVVSFEAKSRTHYPLTLTVLPGKDLCLDWEWDGSVLDGDVVASLSSSYERILVSLCEADEKFVGDLSLGVLGPWHRPALVGAFAPVGPRVVARSSLWGPAEALWCEGVGLSYDDLAFWSGRIAWRLRELGVGPDARVGLCVERSVGLVAGLLGVLRSGGAFVPLDPSYPSARLSEMLLDSGVDVVVADAASAAQLSEVLSGCRVVLVSDALSGVVGSAAPADWSAPVASGDLAYVIYTSGSTGRPKGVAVSHGALSQHIDDFIGTHNIDANDTVLQFATVNFDAALDQILPTLIAGGRIIMRGPEAWDLPALTQTLEDQRITIADLPTTYWQQWLHALPDASTLPRLRQVTVGGEALAGDALRRWQAGPLGHVRLANLYGPTETTVTALGRQTTTSDAQSVIVPIGECYPGRVAYVMDIDGNEAPVGGLGELCIGGGTLARGYLNRPGLTAERFVPDPFGPPGGRLYRSGDLCRRLADGTVAFLGRLDQQVKLRGHRIELGEIEAALRSCPGVREAVAVLHGEGDTQRLVAYAAGGNDLDGPELKRSLEATLPGFMVPSVVMVIAALPVLANGKLDRSALPEPALAAERGFVAPRTALETALLEIWRTVLKRDGLGVTDNFFEAGGDSILSLQIIARAREAGWTLTPRQVFEHPTIEAAAAIAEPIAEPLVTADHLMAAADVVSDAPFGLTPIQSMFFARHPDGPSHWNQAVLLRVSRGVSPASLAAVLAAIVARHDALRLRFVAPGEPGGSWQQYVAPVETATLLQEIDLRNDDGQDDDGQDDAGWQMRLEQAGTRLQQSLDLGTGPLLRAAHIQLDETESEDRLLVAIHHLAVDGVSWRVLFADLQRGISQLSAGQDVSLALTGTSWRNWAQRLRAYAGQPEVQAERGWWLSQLATADASLPLIETNPPTEADRSLGASRTVEWRLDVATTQQLLREAPRSWRLGVEDVLLAALARVLGRWRNQAGPTAPSLLSQGLLVELEGHGREDVLAGVDLSGTVGWFTTTYPVWLPIPAEQDAQASLIAVKEVLRSVPARGLHWGLLSALDDPDPELARELASLPRPQVSFNYLGQFDQSWSAAGEFGFASEAVGASMAASSPMDVALELNGLVADGALSLSWRYLPALLAEATVTELSAAFEAELRWLIALCAAASAEGGGATASDFALSGLSQPDLAALSPSLTVKLGEVQDIYPATPLQQGLLFHSLLRPGEGVYVNQLRLTLGGEIDVAALREAWVSAVSRHDILRTGFAWSHGGEPLQIVRRHVSLPFQTEDWSTDPDYEAHLTAWRDADLAQGFDLADAPLMRLTLIKRPDRDHDLVWSSHHAILDGWSGALLLAELIENYLGHMDGVPVQRLIAPQFKDYVAWLGGQSDGEAWWRRQLPILEDASGLLASFGRPRKPVIGPQRLSQNAGRPLTERLNRAAQRLQVTVHTMVQGAWALLLARYAGRNSVVFGSTVAGRSMTLTGVERITGLLINSLPVGVKTPGGMRLSTWLRDLQNHNTDLTHYEHTSLPQIQKWAGRSGDPMFDTLLVFENYPIDAALRRSHKALWIKEVHTLDRANYPLMLVLQPGNNLHLRWSWEGEHIDKDTVELCSKNYLALLECMADEGDPLLSEIDLAPEAITYPIENYSFRSVLTRISEQAAMSPNSEAVCLGDQRLTYGDLKANSDRLANHLISFGVKPEDRVGVCMSRSPSLIVGLLGALKAGAAYVPLDPSYPSVRLNFMINDAAIRFVVIDQDSLTGLPPLPPGCKLINISELDEINPDLLLPRIHPEQIAYTIYTSGSTGKPKGVGVTHRNVARLLDATADLSGMLFDKTDVWTMFHSYGFDFSVWEVFGALTYGGRLVIVPRDMTLSPELFHRLICREQVTVLNQTPSAFLGLMKEDMIAPRSFGSVRTIIFGGEKLDPTILRPWWQRRGERVPALVNMYGITETTVHVSHYCLDAEDIEASVGSRIGFAIADLALLVLDEDMNPVPVGGVGEIYVAGAGLARGYISRPGLTAERFVPNPFDAISGTRMYRSGDLARYLPSGELEYLGRNDNQVKVRGFRIELGEIEASLLLAPGVTNAVVLDINDNNGQQQIVAYVVMPDTSIVPSLLREVLARHLPTHMLPAAFVQVERLPLTENGKLDRSRLPVPNVGNGTGYVQAITPTEQAVCRIWEEVFGASKVGLNDEFFALGGHSLLAIQIVARLSQELGQKVSLATLFNHPVVSDLATQIDAEPSGKSIVPNSMMMNWLEELS